MSTVNISARQVINTSHRALYLGAMRKSLEISSDSLECLLEILIDPKLATICNRSIP